MTGVAAAGPLPPGPRRACRRLPVASFVASPAAGVFVPRPQDGLDRS